MSGALSAASIRAADPSGMLGDVLAQPHQVEDALWRVESAKVPARDLSGGLAVCGMGGSGIGADLAAAILGPRATRPVLTIRDYGLEGWVRGGILALCSSYSGDTEETLSCFHAAGSANAQRVVLTTGGKLAAAARDELVPVIGVPSGMQPRAAVVYMAVTAVEAAALCGATPSLREELEAAVPLLAELAERWGADSGDDSEPKAIARALEGTIPVVHGTGATAPVARRWKTQLNENAKAAAFASELPEANHNEICGWPEGRRSAPLSGVFLADPGQHHRVHRRVDLTARALEETGAPVVRVEPHGETRTERVLSLVLLGDLVSVYLAVLKGVDPTPVEAIEKFKEALG